jgi:hypothetical protein
MVAVETFGNKLSFQSPEAEAKLPDCTDSILTLEADRTD